MPLKLERGIDSVYLYSWQESRSKNVEFTAVALEGRSAPGIFYIIFNKNDSLLTYKKIAGSDEDGGYRFNFGSVFISRDTFQGIDIEEFTSRSQSEKYKLDKRSSFYVIMPKGAFMMNINIVDSIDVVK